MIRKKHEKISIRILETLQDSEATTDSSFKENGITPTYLAEKGLNKTQVLIELTILKNKTANRRKKRFEKKGRPGNYYLITPLGSIQLFKHRLKDKTVDGVNELEGIRNYYPLITRYWDAELVDLDEKRHHALFNAITNFDIRSRKENYISFSITLPSERNFITFEKTYLLVTTENTENEQMKNLIESKDVKQYTLNEIEQDLNDLITFQFYYYLTYEPKAVLKTIKQLKEGLKRGILLKKDYHENLIEHAKQYRKAGHNFNFKDPVRLETEIIQISEKILVVIESIIEKDKDLRKIIDRQKSYINSMFVSMKHTIE